MISFSKRQTPILFSMFFAVFLFIGLGAADAASHAAKKHGVVPQELQSIESNTEDVIDLAGSGNWTKASQNVTAISNSWATYRKQAANQLSGPFPQSFDSALARLQRDAAAKNTDATMQAANDLSAVVVDMYDLYNPAIPADVGRLDVLQRQIVLDTKAEKWDAADETLAKIKAVWDRLKPSVENHNGAELAKQFQETIQGQTQALKAKNKTTLTAQANHALDLVDGLEKLYT